MTRTVAVVGASGFVGSALVERLRQNSNWTVRGIRAPRLIEAYDGDIPTNPGQDSLRHLGTVTAANSAAIAALEQDVADVDALVNAAGLPRAIGRASNGLYLANAYLPSVLASVCPDGARYIHVSSAAVQGRQQTLDAKPTYAPFSPYSRSKALGEFLLLANPGHAQTVIFRPPAVHGVERQVTRTLARFGRSSFASVAAPGENPTAQALLANVADAIAHMTTVDDVPPQIVSHPSEGLSVHQLLLFLGDTPPRHVPPCIARVAATALRAAGVMTPRLAGLSRRLDSVWFGQEQAASWLTSSGWTPPHALDGWATLGRALTSSTNKGSVR